MLTWSGKKVLKSIIKGLALIIFRQLSNQPSAHVPFIIWVLCFLPSNDPKAWYLLMINKKVNSYWEENFIQKNWDGVSCQVLKPQLSTKQRCISLFVGRWCCSEKRQCLSVLVRNSLTAFQNFSVLRILNFGISDESFITTPLSVIFSHDHRRFSSLKRKLNFAWKTQLAVSPI